MGKSPKAGENPRKGFAYALVGTILLSTYFVTGKYALASPPGKPGGFNVPTFCLLWTASGAVFAFLIVLLRGRFGGIRVERRSRLTVGALGLVTGVSIVVFYSGLRLLDPSFSAFLARSLPVMVILLGVLFLKERLRAVELLPMGFMVLGGVVSVFGRWHAVGLGVTLVLVGYLGFAVHRLLAKVEARRVCVEVLVLYRTGLAAVVIAVWAFVGGKLDFHVDARYWYVLFLGALLSPCLGNMVSFKSYQYWSLSRAALVLMIQPLLVLPMAYVFLHKLPSRQELLGGILILVGAFVMVWIHFRRSGRRAKVEGGALLDPPVDLDVTERT